MNIEVGMVVWLKTGSHSMTVIEKQGENMWKCGWFVADAFHEHIYATEQLTDKETLPQSGTE